MGIIKKKIIIDDEDILNLKNAIETLISSSHDYPLLEVITIKSIIKQWNDSESISTNEIKQ